MGESLVTSILNFAEKTCSGEIDKDVQIVEEWKREEGRVEGRKVVSKCGRRYVWCSLRECLSGPVQKITRLKSLDKSAISRLTK